MKSFQVTKSNDDIYQFGCSKHRYTLDKLPSGTSVTELVDELNILLNSW